MKTNRRLLLLLFSACQLFSLSAFSGTFHATWNFADFTTQPFATRQVTIETIAPYGVEGVQIITGDRRTYATSGGSLVISNLVDGRSYRIRFVGPNRVTQITNSFPLGTSGLVDASAYIATPIQDGATVAYSQTGADARFHNVAGDTSTNATFRGTFKIPAGAVVGYVLTATNADGSLALLPATGGGTVQTNISFVAVTNAPWLNTNNGTAFGLTHSGTLNLIGPDAALQMGDLVLTTTAAGFSWDWLDTQIQLFSYNVATDMFNIQEKLQVTEQLIVSAGQEQIGIQQIGGGSNYLQGITRFESNVLARAVTADLGFTGSGSALTGVFHPGTAGEFSLLTPKGFVSNADQFVLEDSDDSDNKKAVSFANILSSIEAALPGGGGATNAMALTNPWYAGIMRSTNAFPIIRGTVTVPPDSGQTLMEGYTGDTEAGAWVWRLTAVTNGFNPAVNDASPFSAISDVQLHYGYNPSYATGYKSNLPTWQRGHEMTWFNPFLEPVMELYDRVILTNGVLNGQGVGLAYTVGLVSGQVDAAIYSDTLELRNTRGLLGWLNFAANTNNEGVLTIGNGSTASGYLNFASPTNEWLITSDGAGVIGTRGSNYLFTSNGDSMATFYKNANTEGGLLGIFMGGVNPRGIRWSGTNAAGASLYRWEYQSSAGVWHAFTEDLASTHRRTYSLPNNTSLNLSNAAYRTLGTITNTSISGAEFNRSLIVQFDINLYQHGGSFRTVFACNYENSHSTWQELLPLHYSESTDAKRVAIDVRYNNNLFEFRMRRVGANDDVGGGDTFQGVVTVYSQGAAGYLWLTDVSGAGQGATVTQIDASTPLIQTAGRVGINTNNPQSTLHVVGNQLTSGTNTAGQFIGNGAALTNLDLTIQTNASGAGVIAIGKTTYTNLSDHITIAGFSGADPNGEDWWNLVATNGWTTNLTITFPASVSTTTNTFFLGKVLTVTNGTWVRASGNVAAWGTNAAAVRFTP